MSGSEPVSKRGVARSSRSPFVAAVHAALAGNSKLHAWQLSSNMRSGLQTYLVKTQLESDRHVEDETHELTVFVRNGDRVGNSTVSLDPANRSAISKRVDDAVYMAGLGGDDAWELPATGSWPQVAAFDPALSGDQVRATSRAIVDSWRAAVAAHPEARPSSMELFCGEAVTTLENSSGLIATAPATRVSMLTLLLANGEKPAERYSWDERRRASDLEVETIVARAATEAHDLTRAIAPPSGQYAVVIDAEEIVNLLAPIQGNTSAQGLYQKSSRFEIGKPLPIEGKGGELLTVLSNALTPYGLTSYAFDGNGVAGQRVEIVKDNVFVRPWATKQFADYLEAQPTGSFANWEIPAGRTALAELTGSDGPVLYVHSFSWLTPEQGSGNFGSEIRVGYLYDHGTVTPVKGGTVSGNVFAALGTARYAKETVFRGDYLGPAAIRFEGLTVAGT